MTTRGRGKHVPPPQQAEREQEQARQIERAVEDAEHYNSLKRTLGVPKVSDMITHFVEKSGGLEKCEELLKAMRAVPDERRADFIRGCGKTDAGARQVMALSLLGLAIAVETARKGGG